MKWIADAIDKLLINSEDFASRLCEVRFELDIPATKAKGYCYCINLDGDGRPRTNDLIGFVASRIIDYAIPKKEREKAYAYLNSSGFSSKILDLQQRAKALFTGGVVEEARSPRRAGGP